MLEPFGPNVVSTDGDVWRSHIRVTLPSFGEQVQNVVWEETIRQTDMLCQSWLKLGKVGIKERIYQLTMNTMCLASFGWRVDWESGQDDTPPGHKLSLVEAVTEVVLHLPHVLLLPRWALRILPDRTAYVACSEFEKYMDELLARESSALTEGTALEARRENLLTALLRSSRESAKAEKSRTGVRAGLTNREIQGNIFIFLLAGKDAFSPVLQERESEKDTDYAIGYDTTANTMIYTCVVIALYQDIQNKAQEEIDSIYAQLKADDGTGLSYSKHFNRFRYLLAVMVRKANVHFRCYNLRSVTVAHKI